MRPHISAHCWKSQIIPLSACESSSCTCCVLADAVDEMKLSAFCSSYMDVMYTHPSFPNGLFIFLFRSNLNNTISIDISFNKIIILLNMCYINVTKKTAHELSDFVLHSNQNDLFTILSSACCWLMMLSVAVCSICECIWVKVHFFILLSNIKIRRVYIWNIFNHQERVFHVNILVP